VAVATDVVDMARAGDAAVACHDQGVDGGPRRLQDVPEPHLGHATPAEPTVQTAARRERCDYHRPSVSVAVSAAEQDPPTGCQRERLREPRDPDGDNPGPVRPEASVQTAVRTQPEREHVTLAVATSHDQPARPIHHDRCSVVGPVCRRQRALEDPAGTKAAVEPGAGQVAQDDDLSARLAIHRRRDRLADHDDSPALDQGDVVSLAAASAKPRCHPAPPTTKSSVWSYGARAAGGGRDRNHHDRQRHRHRYRETNSPGHHHLRAAYPLRRFGPRA